MSTSWFDEFEAINDLKNNKIIFKKTKKNL